MPETQQLGRELLKRLVSLRELKGQISLEDVGNVFITMAAAINPKVAAESDRSAKEEIRNIASYINNAKQEIFSMGSNATTDMVINDASQHLDEVIRATEAASHTIMDAADSIQDHAAGIGGDKEKAITDAAKQIYEACNFQDISGQRITRVIKLLATIENRIDSLVNLFGKVDGISIGGKVLPMSSVDDEKQLLNGPQLPGHGASQEEIDLLFASLGTKK